MCVAIHCFFTDLMRVMPIHDIWYQFVSLSAHCGFAENTFRHLWTKIFLRILLEFLSSLRWVKTCPIQAPTVKCNKHINRLGPEGPRLVQKSVSESEIQWCKTVKFQWSTTTKWKQDTRPQLGAQPDVEGEGRDRTSHSRKPYILLYYFVSQPPSLARAGETVSMSTLKCTHRQVTCTMHNPNRTCIPKVTQHCIPEHYH